MTIVHDGIQQAVAPLQRSVPTHRFRNFLLGLGLFALVGAGLVVGALSYAKSHLKNPIKTVVVDRTPPPVMLTLKDLAVYKAAAGDYEVLVDVEKDVQYVPQAIAGQRTLFVGVGTVEATVDFRNLGGSAIVTNADRTSAVITLPHAGLSSAEVDPSKSHVASRQRGLVDRIKGAVEDNPDNDKELYIVAANKMNAAAAETGLREKAEANTTKMLTAMLTNLGYKQIDIRYEGDAPNEVISTTKVNVAP
jgi:Protein of unknown function (DUF4230)